MLGATRKCAKCDKQVYPIEELKCLDKIWHKNCFKCSVCNSLLNMKNYKGFDKQPYCVVHYPQQKPTVVSDNPELLRIKENTKIQSNVKYHEDFEKSKGTYTVVADDPETRRILENTKIISQVKYHEDFEKNIKNKHIGGVSGGNDHHSSNEALTKSSNSNNGSLNAINNIHQQQQQPLLVATFKSGGGVDKLSPQQTYTNQQTYQQQQLQQRKIGSIADYDPFGHETVVTSNGTGLEHAHAQRQQQQQRNVYSTSNLHNGRTSSAYSSSSASNIMNYTHQNGNGTALLNGNGNASNHHHYTNNHNHNLDYDLSISQQQQQLYPSEVVTSNEIKTTVYKAIYDYDAKEDDEISFRDGDKFINCEQIDVGWMIGVHEKTGKHGMFPANYAEPVDYF